MAIIFCYFTQFNSRYRSLPQTSFLLTIQSRIHQPPQCLLNISSLSVPSSDVRGKELQRHAFTMSYTVISQHLITNLDTELIQCTLLLTQLLCDPSPQSSPVTARYHHSSISKKYPSNRNQDHTQNIIAFFLFQGLPLPKIHGNSSTTL